MVQLEENILLVIVMWFDKKHLIKHNSILLKDLHGYVLPHAGTEHSGEIISHTLRFKPRKNFTRIIILYYPSQKEPNVDGKYYHEFYVPWKSLDFFINEKWNLNKDIDILGINLQNLSVNLSFIDMKNTLIVVSADFSHFLPMDRAIELENKASHSMQHRELDMSEYNRVVDDIISFEQLYRIIPDKYVLQWVGRTRSKGEKGVGYLSFLIRDPSDPNKEIPNGMFVTAYDKQMNARECLGEWFDDKNYSLNIENNLVQKVLTLGKKTSRLTGGRNKQIPITNYTITYLYKSNKPFIRGWHGVKYNSFFLPDVFLENTYNSGKWIQKNDKLWDLDDKFDMKETLDKLTMKSGGNRSKIDYILYSSNVIHHKI
jgi:hypothetical protein